MYHCGPTVYGIQHIGNLSMFVFTDMLRRVLEYKGFVVTQVINFTDFGHLTSDADEGEDKMARGLRRDGLLPSIENMQKLGKKYAGVFLDDLSKLNINTQETIFPYASEYVDEQIRLIEILEEKGFTYTASDGVYFDISKCHEYGKLGGLSESNAQARVSSNPEKRNPRDFALWKFNSELGFPSEWGQGFPGWHIECSAMIIKLLGEQIDIHTGGVEHIPVHHNNEIVQSEAATGKVPFAKYWLHRAHLQISGEKIAKSEGNVIYLSQIIEKGFSPLAYRYFLLMAHYRTPVNFSWEALEAAENAYRKLKEFFAGLGGADGKVIESYKKEFSEAISNDLNTPEALAVVWQLVKDESVSPLDKRATLLDFDQVLGLELENNEYEIKDIPAKVQQLVKERESARVLGDYPKSDQLRQEIESLGFSIEDTSEGPRISKS